MLFGGNARAVVVDTDNPLAAGMMCGDVHARRRLADVLEGISYQVLQELLEQYPVAMHSRQLAVRYFRLKLFDGWLQRR